MKKFIIFLAILVFYISYCSNAIIGDVIDATGDPQCPYRDFISANPKDCTSYWQCKDGKRKLKKCSGDDRFDVRKNLCVSDFRAECAQQKDWQGFECSEAPKFAFYRNDKCDRYWICKQSVATLAYCEKGKRFDVKTKRCMSDWWARCEDNKSDGKKPEVTTPEPTEPNL